MPILSFFPGGGGETASVLPVASLTPDSNETYLSAFSGLDAGSVSLYAGAISDNAQITSETSVVYIDHGKLHFKFMVGDQIAVSLEGTDYLFDIIGFNHDALTDTTAYGEATTTGKAGITLQMHDIFATQYAMNTTNTNVGGWHDSVMRNEVMTTMYEYLPSEWEPIVKLVTKTTGSGNQSTVLYNTNDKCFLLSQVEIAGAVSDSANGEGSQYAYYKAGNSRKKTRNGTANGWWTRSPVLSQAQGFCRYSDAGNTGIYGAGAVYGVTFAFCV